VSAHVEWATRDEGGHADPPLQEKPPSQPLQEKAGSEAQHGGSEKVSRSLRVGELVKHPSEIPKLLNLPDTTGLPCGGSCWAAIKEEIEGVAMHGLAPWSLTLVANPSDT